jgi:hypothetical protein
MMIPIEKGFSIVEVEEPPSPRELFERRAEQIARAAELHVRRMIQDETALLAQRSVGPGSWTVDPEGRDAVPFGLKRRVVLRVPVFGRDETASDESASELRRIRGLMAQLALDLIAQVIEINRYFAKTGLVKPPEDSAQGEGACRFGFGFGFESSGKTMSGGSDGSSLRRRA